MLKLKSIFSVSISFLSYTFSLQHLQERTDFSGKAPLVFHHFIRNETLVAVRNTIHRDKLQRQKRDLFNDLLLTDFPEQAEKAPFHLRQFLTWYGQLLKLLL